MDFDVIRDAVAIGVELVRVGFAVVERAIIIDILAAFTFSRNRLGTVAEAVAVRIGVERIRRIGAVDFVEVRDAVAVRIGLVRIRFAVIQLAIVVGILAALTDSADDVGTVAEAVTVRIGIERIRRIVAKDFGSDRKSVV